MDYSITFELENDRDIQAQLLKEHKNNFCKQLKKELTETEEENKKREMKNEVEKRKIRMLKANYNRIEAFYQKCRREGGPHPRTPQDHCQ